MSSPSINLYKQIILYILHRSRVSLAQHLVIDTIVNLGYTDYINAQSALGELIVSELVVELDTYHRTYISLSESGEEALGLFIDQLSPDIRREIDDYLKNNHVETLDESVLISDYKLDADGNYTVTCSIRDRESVIFSVSISVYSEDDAMRVCDAWKTQSEPLYGEALRRLLGEDINNQA
ncbi:MAG: DUF4364 family protein [Eubacterium sp.]|nr:DUF4364 family protein [Eubacterium sp.]